MSRICPHRALWQDRRFGDLRRFFVRRGLKPIPKPLAYQPEARASGWFRDSFFVVGLVGCVGLLNVGMSQRILAQNWPMFRGPEGRAAAPLPTWPRPKNVKEILLWSAKLPGPGASSPIVWGDRVFVTCYSGYGVSREQPGDPRQLRRHLLCFERHGGNLLWEQTVDGGAEEDPYQGFITEHGYASSTPVTDGQHVFAFFGKAGILAYTIDGQPRWRSLVGTESDPARWGGGSSPVLFEDLVIINAGNEAGAVIAYRKQDGTVAWKVREPACKNSWSTPILVRKVEPPELVLSVPGKLFAVHPRTGEILWECPSPIQGTVVPSPIVVDDIVISMGSRQGQAIALRCGGRGDVEETHVVWRASLPAGIGTPLVVGQRLIWVSMGTILAADLATGKESFRQRLDNDTDGGPTGGSSRGNRGFMSVYASPVSAGDEVCVLGRSGAVHILRTNPELAKVATFRMGEDPGPFDGTPACVNDQIFIRSAQALYCLKAPTAERSDSNLAADKISSLGSQTEASAELNELVELLCGSFTSAQQAQEDEDFFSIDLHIVPIWPERASAAEGVWLYVEQAASAAADKPYRQRIYRVSRTEQGFQSEVYELPGDPLRFAGAWKDASKLGELDPSQLTKKEGCTVALQRTGPGHFRGGTQGRGCGSNLRGATYATSEVEINAQGLKTLDRGYNARHEQVWGSEKGPYIFLRTAPGAPSRNPTPSDP